MSLPLVSCLTATYGRPILLGEVIKCFLDQDYKNKELIILNDQVGVELYMQNWPSNVRIYNHPTRFNSLGEKRNYLKKLGNGEFFCIWDDDDLYTPWRISESVDLMLKNPNYDILKPKDALLSTDNKNYKIASNLFHSQSIITKEYMRRKQYPNKSIGEDADFEKGARIKIVDMFPDIFYIYRWGLNIHHVSGIPNDKQSWQKSLTFASYKISGRIGVKAEFQRDYWKDIEMVLGKMNSSWQKEWIRKLKIVLDKNR